ncbi:MAG: hypothetical protein ABS79_00990 [Planctomycetes bacterium SCN 63-9]|nr:MAG: hypothetical protein ABS79_00990 [Planctomycetes bacterium SCN 63-9]
MLIPSPRHTAKDLELWAELESADKIIGARPRLADKAARSIAAIREFASRGPCYASVSWGKDSVVLAHLCVRAGTRIPLVHIKAVPVTNPESYRVRDAFLAAFDVDYRELIADYTAIPEGLSSDETEVAKDRIFYAAFRSLGLPHLSGIRADESRGRKIRMKKFGESSANACAPIGWWKTADIFGYLAVHGLPVHPNYGMLGGGRWKREHLRVDELFGDRGTGFGRAEWEREYYGETYRRMQSSR